MSTNKPIRVLIGTPNENFVPWQAYQNHIDQASYLGAESMRMICENIYPRYEFHFWSIGRIFTPLARENLCTMALNKKMDYVMQIDNDMLYPRDMFFQLVRHQKDIVCPLAFTRRPPHVPVMYIMREGWDTVSQDDFHQHIAIRNYPKNALVRVDSSGFGAALIHTRVLKKMPQPWFMGSKGTGEDILFCLEARKYGFQTFVDTSVKTGHLSDSTVIDEESVHKLWKQNGFEPEKEETFVKYGYVPLPYEQEPSHVG